MKVGANVKANVKVSVKVRAHKKAHRKRMYGIGLAGRADCHSPKGRCRRCVVLSAGFCYSGPTEGSNESRRDKLSRGDWCESDTAAYHMYASSRVDSIHMYQHTYKRYRLSDVATLPHPCSRSRRSHPANPTSRTYKIIGHLDT